MKKTLFAFAFVASLVVALVAASVVSAQGNAPTAPQAPATGYGRGGMMGGRGVGTEINLDSLLHDDLMAIYADALGISVDELNARLEGGETLAEIAYAEGLTPEQFFALMSDARAQAIEQAVLDGTLTQEQADWLASRPSMQMGSQVEKPLGSRMGGQMSPQMGGRSARGTGFGDRGANMEDCPLVTP